MNNIYYILFASLIGSIYLYYGRKQQNFTMMICGMILCTDPYFISNTVLFIVVNVALTIIPVVRR